MRKEKIEKSLYELRDKIVLPSSLHSIHYVKNKNNIFRVAMITILVFLIGGSLTYATYPYLFKKSNADQGLITAEKSEKVSHVNKSVKKNGIKVTVQGVVSDSVRTVLNIRVDGAHLNGGIPDIKSMKLSDDKGTKYTLSHWGQGDSTHSDFDEMNIEFNGSPTTSAVSKLSLKKINGVAGKWELTVPVVPSTASEFTTDVKDIKHHIELSRLEFTSTYTIIEGKSDNFDFTNTAKLSNGKEHVELIKAEGEKSDHMIRFYFPPIKATDDLTLTICTFAKEKTLYSLKIPLK